MDSSVDISPSEMYRSIAREGHDHGEPNIASGLRKQHMTPSSGLLSDDMIPKTMEQSRQFGFVTDLVNKNQIVVFSKSQCPHCTDTKSLLQSMGVNFKTVELDQMQDGSLVQNVLANMTNARTVPRIFIDGQCVGGNSDLKDLDKTGELDILLAKMKKNQQHKSGSSKRKDFCSVE